LSIKTTNLSVNITLLYSIVDDGDCDEIALFRNFPGRCDDSGAERSELFARLLAQIANRQFEAGFGDVCGHGLSHRAQPYKANLGLHTFFYLKCCASNKDSVELFE